jgi:chromosome segregation ATPase
VLSRRLRVISQMIIRYLWTLSGAITTIGLVLLGVGSALDSWPLSIGGAIAAALGVASRLGRTEARHQALIATSRELMITVVEIRARLDRQSDRLEREMSSIGQRLVELDARDRTIDDRLDDQLATIAAGLDAAAARIEVLEETVSDQGRSLDMVHARRAWTSSRSSLSRRAELHLSESMGTLERKPP